MKTRRKLSVSLFSFPSFLFPLSLSFFLPFPSLPSLPPSLPPSLLLCGVPMCVLANGHAHALRSLSTLLFWQGFLLNLDLAGELNSCNPPVSVFRHWDFKCPCQARLFICLFHFPNVSTQDLNSGTQCSCHKFFAHSVISPTLETLPQTSTNWHLFRKWGSEFGIIVQVS